MIKDIFTKETFRVFLKHYALIYAIYALLLLITINFVALINGEGKFTLNIDFAFLKQAIYTSMALLLINLILLFPFSLGIFYGQIITGKTFLKLGASTAKTMQAIPYWVFGLLYIPIKIAISMAIYYVFKIESVSILQATLSISYFMELINSPIGIILEYYILGYLIWRKVYEVYIEPRLPDEQQGIEI